MRQAYLIYPSLFRMKVEKTIRNSTTGTMKTIKIAAGKIHFPTAYFFVFPGCFASGWRHLYCRRARVCQWHLQLAKLQSSFAKGFLRVAHRIGSNPSVSPSDCHLPLHKEGFFYSHQRVFLVSAEKCLSDKMSKFRYWVQGRWPGWVQG